MTDDRALLVVPVLIALAGIYLAIEPASGAKALVTWARFNDRLFGRRRSSENYVVRQGLVRVFGLFLIFFGAFMFLLA